MKKNIIILILLVLFIAFAYHITYTRYTLQSASRKDAQFRISVDEALYRAAEKGDLKKVQSSLRAFLDGEVRNYMQKYGDEKGVDGFAKKFADAKIVADQYESNAIPLIKGMASKIGTNLPIQIVPEK